MATAEVAPVVNSAQQLEPGIVQGEKDNPVNAQGAFLDPQQGGQFPPSNIEVKIMPFQANNARPERVSFAALHDPKLRMVRAIPLDVSVEDSTVVVTWPETNEFGTGPTLSGAIDDFSSSLRELYKELFAPNAKLGPDLQKIKHVLGQHIQPCR